MTPRQLLARARAIIMERGWTQWAYYRRNEGFCLTGALWSAAGVSDESLVNGITHVEDPTAFKTARAELREVTGSLLVAWNDTPGRTRDEVVAALAAAEALCLEEP